MSVAIGSSRWGQHTCRDENARESPTSTAGPWGTAAPVSHEDHSPGAGMPRNRLFLLPLATAAALHPRVWAMERETTVAPSNGFTSGVRATGVAPTSAAPPPPAGRRRRRWMALALLAAIAVGGVAGYQYFAGYGT